VERFGNFARRKRAASQAFQDGAPRGIGEGLERASLGLHSMNV
jgi:hypothetical protein